MKVKELMIGDWIHNNFTNNNFQVWPSFLAQATNYGRNLDRTLDDVNCAPIPLTKEILEANGFKYREWAYDYDRFDQWNLDNIDDKGEYHGTLVTINRRKDGEWMDTRCRANTMYDINYVHQLQNFLSQCGVDKEIKLED